MKTLYLLRHAKSSWKEDVPEDFDRPLNKRGRAAATAVGRYLAEQRVAPSQVLCSSAKRTRETLERMQEGMGAALPARFEKGIYLAEAPTLLRRLKRLNDSLASAMLIGHNPGLERLALMLAADSDEILRRQLAAKFPTGALAVLDADIGRWADLAPGCAALTAFVRARDLQLTAD
jgi:phosphohistidine phosphatase